MEWKDSHDQYLDEWVSFPYEIKRYQEWLPVYIPFPDTGDILAQEMYDAIKGKVENYEDYLAQIIYYLGQLTLKLNAIEYYMTKAANQMEAYLDSTKVLEIEQIHGVDASLVIGPTYNDLVNIESANLTDWQIIGEGGINLVDFAKPASHGTTRYVWSDDNFIYLASSIIYTSYSQITTYSIDGSGLLTELSNYTGSEDPTALWNHGNFLLGIQDASIFTYTVDGAGVITRTNAYWAGGGLRGVWGDDNFIYLANFHLGLKSYSINPVSGAVTPIDTIYVAYGATTSVWGDNNFIYAIQQNDFCSYTVDGSGYLTLVASTPVSPGKISGDGNFIYIAGIDNLSSYTVDGSGYLTLVDSIAIFEGRGDTIYINDNYIYTFTGYYPVNIIIHAVDGSGNLTYISIFEWTWTMVNIDGANNFLYVSDRANGICIFSTSASQILYEYEGVGWDNDSIITKYIADWDFGKDYLIHPLITFDGDYGIYPNINIFTKAKTTIEGSKDKISDSEEVLGDYI